MSIPTTLLYHLFILSCLHVCLSSTPPPLTLLNSTTNLSGAQTLISKHSNFVLGFFSPNPNSNSSYLAIWYNKVSPRTTVWIANRDSPIQDPSKASLAISGDGNLVLTASQPTVPVWSTDVDHIANASTVVELQDDGNLVLRHGSNPKLVFWQCFDHPTHTWLPGAKLGFNKITGKNQLLTSWKSEDDPASGLYSLQIDPNGSGQYFIKWNNTKTYWTSGVWDGKIFSGVPEMRLNYIYNFTYVSNERENYFSYSTYDNSVITRFIMDYSGQIKQLTWNEESSKWNLFWSQPELQCDVYSLCGPFGVCEVSKSMPCSCLDGFEKPAGVVNGTCVRKAPLECNRSSGDGMQDAFNALANFKLPENFETHNLETLVGATSIEACKAACLRNCSCTAYSFKGTQCDVLIGDVLNVQQLSEGSGGETLYIRLAASEFQSSGSQRNIIIGVAMGASLIILCLVVYLIVVRRNRKKDFKKLRLMDSTLVAFQYKDMKRVTKNFSVKIGRGAFGTVFKGTLPDSTEVAVKKLDGMSQGEKQFRAEVSTIGTIQHVNLARLRGFCSEGTTKRLLVYDYMPNGSLDAILFKTKTNINIPVLDWKTRYNIALGVARGLSYLHDECRDCIIHCDIKPENILLDASLVPKVSDFGLAKLLGRDFSRVLTTMRGTRGYLAPEWIAGLPITPKADVFSYGMMLFEIMSGRRNLDEEAGGYFPAWAAKQMMEGDVLSVLDPKLLEVGVVGVEEVARVCKVACWCIQDEEVCRPSMGQVVKLLEGVVDVNMPPLPRSVRIMSEDDQQNIVFFKHVSNQSSQVQSTTSTDSTNRSMHSASSE